MSQSTTMTIRLDPELKTRLDKLAAATHRSKSFLASEAVREFIEINEWQIQEIMAALKEANEGNNDQLLTLAEEMEERDTHYASVLGQRKRAISLIEPIITCEDETIAEAVEELVKRGEVASADRSKAIDELHQRAQAAATEIRKVVDERIDAVGKRFSWVDSRS